jgi:hypothetical protein
VHDALSVGVMALESERMLADAVEGDAYAVQFDFGLYVGKEDLCKAAGFVVCEGLLCGEQRRRKCHVFSRRVHVGKGGNVEAGTSAQGLKPQTSASVSRSGSAVRPAWRARGRLTRPYGSPFPR